MSNENEASIHSKTTGHSRKCQVIADYQALYPDPISVKAGEPLTISEKVDYWNGNPDWIWVWCTNSQAKSGWVPADHVTES